MAEKKRRPEPTPLDAATAEGPARRGQVIKSAARAIRILRSLMRAPGGLHLAEIGRQQGLHKATALRLLRTLTAEGIVARDDSGRYAPNPRFLLALDPFLRPVRSLLADVQAALDRLARRTAGTAMVVLPDETGRRAYAPMAGLPSARVYLDAVAAEPMPLHRTASGKCYLAALPEEHLDAYLDGVPEHIANGREVSRSQLMSELRRVRRQGHAFNRGETIPGFAGVAVPLRGPEEAVVGGLGLALFAESTSGDQGIEVIPLLQETSALLSELLSDRSWAARPGAVGPGGESPPSMWDSPAPSLRESPSLPVRSVFRMIRLMAAIIRCPAGLPLNELAAGRRLDRSTTRRLLQTLVSGGLVRRDSLTGRYRGHPLMWVRLSPALLSAAPLVEATRQLLQRLADAVGSTVCLSVVDADGRHAVALQYALPPGPVSYHPGQGAPPALHASASGKCLLAYHSKLDIENYLAAGLGSHTENTITSPAELRRQLALVREAGFALNREEFTSGVGGVGVPVHAPDGAAVAALVVVPLIAELTDAHLREWLPQLRAAASSLSEMLGQDWQERLAAGQP